MTNKNPLSIFKGKQGYMYAALFLLWQNYAQRQDDFAKKNTKYTKELGDEQQEAIKKARDLPNVAVRRSIPKQARNVMSKTATQCTNNWQELAGLIESAYPQNQWDIKKALAGYASYTAAAKCQWDAVATLNKAGFNFINDNTNHLMAGGMLPGFPNVFADGKEAFDILYNDYYEIKKNFNKQTLEKANANNAIYATAIGLMNDAKRIYRNDAQTRAQFTYSSLIKSVRGEGFTKSGCCFLFREGNSTLPVTTAMVLITSDAFSQVEKATELGIARCQLAAGTYQFTVTAPSFTTLMGSVKVKDGTMHQKTIRLNKGVTSEDVITAIAAIK